MALHSPSFLLTPTPSPSSITSSRISFSTIRRLPLSLLIVSSSLDNNNNKKPIPTPLASASSLVVGGVEVGVGEGAVGVGNSNYVVPFDKSSCFTRPLVEILRDLNKRISDSIIKPDQKSIPWYHANRMLSFYAPGWCGEIRDVVYSDNGSVTVIYRVTIRGSDGEAFRESSGTTLLDDDLISDPVAAAEEIAFGRACARFGLGLYLYHEQETS